MREKTGTGLQVGFKFSVGVSVPVLFSSMVHPQSVAIKDAGNRFCTVFQQVFFDTFVMFCKATVTDFLCYSRRLFEFKVSKLELRISLLSRYRKYNKFLKMHVLNQTPLSKYRTNLILFHIFSLCVCCTTARLVCILCRNIQWPTETRKKPRL